MHIYVSKFGSYRRYNGKLDNLLWDINGLIHFRLRAEWFENSAWIMIIHDWSGHISYARSSTTLDGLQLFGKYMCWFINDNYSGIIGYFFMDGGTRSLQWTGLYPCMMSCFHVCSIDRNGEVWVNALFGFMF